MEVSTRAKERFCKDCNIPIRLFKEPYFTDRLKLYDKFFGTIEKWNVFVEELQKYKCEQDYFEEYNRVKDAAILNIKYSEAYQRFNEEDMNLYSINDLRLSSKDIYKPTNHGKTFISIDMRKANFSSLHHYDPEMFKDVSGVANTWEEFIGKFTKNQHIINSKYIRQVILGNCNPKRHITYEKYLMYDILKWLTFNYIDINDVVFFSNDEIIINVTHLSCDEQDELYFNLKEDCEDLIIPVKVQLFTLNKIDGIDGYYKEIFCEDENTIEFKCLDNYMFPFVMRKVLGEEITESDKVFYHEGLLAKFIEVPEFEVNMEGVI